MTRGEPVTHLPRPRHTAWARAAALPLVAACLITAACGSNTTSGKATTTATSAAAPSAPASSTITLPPGIAKDSPQDLNSTKDMTGVVTTVPGTKSIYIDYLPDVCKFIPDSVVAQLGATSKEKGFERQRLVAQACVLTDRDATFTITTGLLINNIYEVLGDTENFEVKDAFEIKPGLIASVYQKNGDLPDGRGNSICRVSWGTFYGSASVIFGSFAGFNGDVCAKAINSAQILSPYFPREPQQMRTTK